jgi:MFS family permease
MGASKSALQEYGNQIADVLACVSSACLALRTEASKLVLLGGLGHTPAMTVTPQPVADPPPTRTTPEVRASLAAAMLCAATTGVGFGLCLPLLALRLDDAGHSATTIGLIAAAAALSTLIGTLLTPASLRRIGVRTLIGIALAFSAFCFALFPLFESPVGWFILRVLFGIGITIAYVASEAWILELAPAQSRGRILGLYSSTLAGGVGSGAALVGIIGHQGASPFLLGAAVFLLGALPLLLRGPGVTAPEAHGTAPKAVFTLMRRYWPLMLAPLVMGAIETAALSLLPVYVRQLPLADPAGAHAVAIYASANVLMQVPIGLLADRIGIRRTLAVCGGFGLIGPALIAWAGSESGLLYPVLFLYSGFVTGIYTVGLAALAHAFPPERLASANAAFALSYGFGMSASPILSGFALDWLGANGLLVSLALFAVPFLLGQTFRPHKQG